MSNGEFDGIISQLKELSNDINDLYSKIQLTTTSPDSTFANIVLKNNLTTNLPNALTVLFENQIKLCNIITEICVLLNK